MSIAYNSKISERANNSLRRRTEILQRRKRIVVLVSIIVISLIVILTSSIKTFADSNVDRSQIQKMYTSVQVKSGDTVWSIAGEHMLYADYSKRDCVNEICEINSLSNGEIHSGQYIIVPYFVLEEN